MIERMLPLRFHIDTNCINAKSKNEEMNLLEQWHKNKIISIECPTTAQTEALKGHDTQRTDKALSYVENISLSINNTMYKEISSKIFGDKLTENQVNDVRVIISAIEDNSILVTLDGKSKKQPGGILGNAKWLDQKFQLKVLHPKEAVALVRKYLSKRDKSALFHAKIDNSPLPNWVRNDDHGHR